MKNSYLSAISLSLGLGVSACASAPHPQPESCPLPKTAALIPSAPSTSPSINIPVAIPHKPLNEGQFYANVLACEATANANAGYMQSIGRRIESDSVSPDQLPCNVVQDIRDNFQRVIDHCEVVIEPPSIFLETKPLHKKLINQAAELTEASRQAIKLIEKQAPHCFSPKTNLAFTLTPPDTWE